MATITTINASDLITNSRSDINSNFANLNSDKIETSVLDTDTTLAANSDAKIPSQKAVKAYIDSGGNTNASTTVRGVVELATSAEITAGTATGATGAALVMTPDQMKLSQNPIVRTYLTAGSPATWTKPAGLKYVVVEVQGGGGGGRGMSSATGEAAGGGAAGGYSKKLIAVASLGTTETVTTGAGGAGSSSGSNGTAGGTSSFGSHCSATGGAGGTAVNDAAGGAGSSGDINIDGQNGGVPIANYTTDDGIGGLGGNSMLGLGGMPRINGGSGDAKGYGAGGAGAADTGGAAETGGSGSAGIVIVTEYYS